MGDSRAYNLRIAIPDTDAATSMLTVVFTTGATITFTALLECITEEGLLESLLDLGIETIYIQYGNEYKSLRHVSRDTFEALWKKHRVNDRFALSQTAYGDRIEYKGKLHIVTFPFDHDLASFIDLADIVVAHAGTGSILDVLRQKKKLLVVSNDKLMDNHQHEIARAFESKQHVCALTSTEIEHRSSLLTEKILMLLKDEIVLVPLPAPRKVLDSIITREMNLLVGQGYPATSGKSI